MAESSHVQASNERMPKERRPSMPYTELIKSFERIRNYMRDFYVYGFKSRTEYDKKSARSYDNERRRMESWLAIICPSGRPRVARTCSSPSIHGQRSIARFIRRENRKVSRTSISRCTSSCLTSCMMSLFALLRAKYKNVSAAIISLLPCAYGIRRICSRSS